MEYTRFSISALRTAARQNPTAFASAVNVATYGIAQLLNLCFQGFVVWWFGAEKFGPLAYILSINATLITLSDLGFTHHFIREKPEQIDWKLQWRTAIFLRTSIIAAISTVTFLYYSLHFAGSTNVILFGATMSLASIFSAFNPSPMLYALQQPIAAALVQPTQILLTAISFTSLCMSGVADIHNSSTLLGFCYCAGYASHFVFYGTTKLGISAALPAVVAWTRDRTATAFIKPCLTIWSTGLSGTLFARLGTLVIEHQAPQLLAAYYLLEQICNGVAGGLLQIQKVLIPYYTKLEHKTAEFTQNFVDIWSGAVGCMYLALLIVLILGNEQIGFIDLEASKAIFLLYLTERTISAYGSGLVIHLFANRHEYHYAKIVAITTAIGGLIGIVLLSRASIEIQFAIRILVVLIAFIITARLTSIRVFGLQSLLLAILPAAAISTYWLSQNGIILWALLLLLMAAIPTASRVRKYQSHHSTN